MTGIAKWVNCLAAVLLLTSTASASETATPDCSVTAAFEFDRGAAEGLAISPDGDVYVGNINTGEIWVAPHADFTRARLLADLVGDETPFTFVLGMDVTNDGTLFVAVNAFGNLTLHGLWRIDRDGTASLAAPFPPFFQTLLNDVAIDERGNVYVSDSLGGAIWRVAPGGRPEIWNNSPLWKAGRIHPFFRVPFGVNGLTYHQGALYGGIYLDGRIVRVTIGPDGTAGEPEDLVGDTGLIGVDGIEVDVTGDIYAAVNDADALVRIDATQLGIEPVITGLSAPASIAVSKNRKTVFIANLSSSAAPPRPQRAPAVMVATPCR